MWAIVGTWAFAVHGVEAAAPWLAQGGDAMEAVIRAIEPVENDISEQSVGKGGLPNAAGEVELDAAVMDGRTLQMGAVAAMKGFAHPTRIARDVMLRTNYALLAGKGAEDFAHACGYEPEELLTEAARTRWQEAVAAGEVARVLPAPHAQQITPEGHDTVGFCALSTHGDIAVGVSTSGLGFKLPGRVGDSPLIGSGFYADNAVGAAAATGVGEDIMKGVISFRAVEHMRRGLHPQAAAELSVREVHHTLLMRGRVPGNIAMVCLNRRGEVGAAANHGQFSFAWATQAQSVQHEKVTPVVQRPQEDSAHYDIATAGGSHASKEVT